MIDFLKTSKDILNLRKKTITNNDNIKSNKVKIELRKKSILLETRLNNFPSCGNGSVDSYNRLNERFELYDTQQFNKITRYIVFIEKLEKEYNVLVSKSKKTYLTEPNSNVFKELINNYNFLSLNYQLLNILIDEVNKDKLLFNKVFNELEDKGIFLNEIEKIQIETFTSIKKSLIQTVDLLDEVTTGITDLSDSVGYMSTGIDSMSHDISNINSKLWNR